MPAKDSTVLVLLQGPRCSRQSGPGWHLVRAGGLLESRGSIEVRLARGDVLGLVVVEGCVGGATAVRDVGCPLDDTTIELLARS
jgi:hypothetical protein